jgi:TonB family protein
MRQSVLRLQVLAIALAGALDLPAAAQAGGETATIADSMQSPQVQKIEVVFPNEIRRYGRSVGPIRVAKLTIVVGKDGKARDVQIAQSSGFSRYDQAALSAAREATYLPAINRGTPVESRLDYDVSFGLLCNRAAGDSTCDHGKYPTTCSATVCALLMR